MPDDVVDLSEAFLPPAALLAAGALLAGGVFLFLRGLGRLLGLQHVLLVLLLQTGEHLVVLTLLL